MTGFTPDNPHTDTRMRPASLLAASPLYASAVADTFGGALHGTFPLALAVRAVLLVLFVVWALESPQTPQQVRRLLLVVMLYLGGSLFAHYVSLAIAPLLSMDLSASLRLIYAPLLLAYIAATMRVGLLTPQQLRDAAVLFGWLVLLSLFLGKVTGLGGEIGGRGANIEAGKGFMIGANEVGLMLMLSCPFVVIDLQRRLRSLGLTAVIALPLYAAAAVYVFTKSSLVAPLVCTVSLYGLCRERTGLPLIIARLLLLAMVIGLLVAGLQLREQIQIFADKTFFSALINEGLISFLFRGRQNYIDALYPQLSGNFLNALILIFGIGEYALRQLSVQPLLLSDHVGTNFEMDVFDLVGAFGLIGALLYGALMVGVFRMLPTRGALRPGMRFAVAATAVHAAMAGHVVFSPQVMTLIILSFAASVPHCQAGSACAPAN